MKNRLDEFQAAAASSPFKAVSPTAPMVERTGDLELGAMSPAAPSGANPMDLFLATVEDVRVRLERIGKAVGDIEHMHRQALNAVNMDEATRLGRLIDELVNRTNAESQHIRRTLKSLTGETEALKASGGISPSDLRIRANQQSRYAKKFMAAMNKFQAMQTAYQAKYRQQLERQYLIVKPTATRDELDKLTYSADATAMLNQQIFAMANRAQAQKTLAEMKERHHDIQSIEKSIKELHQMFVDMAIIVEQQGEMIDKVEDHVSNILEYTEHAAGEMRQAVVKQRGIQKKKWILLIICTVLLIIIGLALWLSLTGGGGGGSTIVQPIIHTSGTP